jgi:hypothetical protein
MNVPSVVDEFRKVVLAPAMLITVSSHPPGGLFQY